MLIAAQRPKFADSLLRGQAAVGYLNRSFGVQIATNSGFTSTKLLKDLLLKDSDLAIDPASNSAVFTCTGLVPDPSRAIGISLVSEPDPIGPETLRNADGLPLLSSRLNSTKKIFLDFDGCSISGTRWLGGASFTNRPFDPSSNGVAFDLGEQERIIAIWRAVSEDYSVFDVDVTTIDPGIDGIVSNYPNDDRVGIRICIGGSSSDWYGSAGGVAYLRTFGSNVDTPAFVFPDNLSNGDPKSVWEATSHEAGHTLGLRHQALDSAGDGYYYGHGEWAPIMGVSYYKQITQFSKGEFPKRDNLNPPQDDFLVMSGYLQPIADDHGNNNSGATLLGSNTSMSGLLGLNDAADFFKIHVDEGSNVTIHVDLLGPWGSHLRTNLDISVSLLNSSNGPVAYHNPAGGSPAIINKMSLPKGTYYIKILKNSFGNPADTGYSTYGSVGRYTIQANFIEFFPPPPSRTTSSTAFKSSSSTRTSFRPTSSRTSSTRTPSTRTSTSTRPPAPTNLPNTPLMLPAKVIRESSKVRIQVQWKDQSNSETTWELNRCNAANCQKSLFDYKYYLSSKTQKTVGLTITTFGAQVAGITHGYRVRACQSANVCSRWSSVVYIKY